MATKPHPEQCETEGRVCVFFDRDGVVNRAPDPERYVTRFEAFQLLPAFWQALSAVREAGAVAVVVTNQRGLATGLVASSELERMHQHLVESAAERGLEILDILVCPFDDDQHPWRKPQPGMLLEAARRHRLDLARSWMVGDQESDVLAGRQAGCRTVRLLRREEPSEADVVIRDEANLAETLRQCLAEGALKGAPNE